MTSDRAKENPQVWIVDSAYTGELNARLGVAKRLGLPYEIVPLPNGDAAAYGQMLRARRNGAASAPLALISGTGEETVAEIADLRPLFGDRLLNVYLASILPDELHPRLCEYDLVASPQLQGENIVTTLGVPHPVTREALAAAACRHEDFFAELPRPLVGLLVGGNTRYCDGFDAVHAAGLGRRVAKIGKSLGGGLVVANSRRTPELALAALLAELAGLNARLLDWRRADRSFYHALLAHADLFIVTGDSLSLCSEAAYTGKPLLIDLCENATETYHREIVGKLLEYGAAKPLSDSFAPWAYQPPDPAGMVAEAIRKRLNALSSRTPNLNIYSKSP
jgi:mitochondrial fission protein ELM1